MANKKARLSKIGRFAEFLRTVLGRFYRAGYKTRQVKEKRVLEENRRN